MADPRNNPQQQQQPQSPTQAQPRREEREGGRSMEPLRRGGEMARPGWGGVSPFSFMRRFIGDMDRIFEDFGFGPSMLSPLMSRHELFARGTWAPQIDVFERGDQLIVHADLPGLKQEDVRVNVDQGALTISGERSHSHEHEKGGVYQCERSYGTFQRTIPLPEGVNPESIQASFENGVLEVTMPMPKEAQAKGRSIPIGKGGGPAVKH